MKRYRLKKDRNKLFWSYVLVKPESCWEWQGALAGRKYGGFWDGIRQVKAHRYSYELANGKIPYRKIVMHICDNMKCVNPQHLTVGTCKDNIQDALKKGRMCVGEQFWCAKTNDETVLKIRADFRKPFTLKDECERLAKKFNVGWRTVEHIIRGRTWKHLL